MLTAVANIKLTEQDMNEDIESANGAALPAPGDLHEAARLYIERGWAIVPIPLGEKAPRLKGWQTKSLSATDLPLYFKVEGNIGIRLGDPSRRLVDVDLDCVEAIALAHELLPSTGLIFGRASKRHSHWLYNVDEPPQKTIPLLDHEGGMLVELRSNGGQTIFPPSLHPCGERITWSAYTTPTSYSVAYLLQRVRALAAAALLTRFWPSDGRHMLSMAVGGALARAGFDVEEVASIVRAICRVAADPK